jgi:hypothetical protein
MNQQPTLGFDTQSPVVRDTRARAHAKARPSKNAFHAEIIQSLYCKAWNADGWAESRELSFLQTRPRFSELFKAGLIWQVGTGKSALGNPQDIYDLRPAVRERINTLAERFGIDKAAEQIVTEFIR